MMEAFNDDLQTIEQSDGNFPIEPNVPSDLNKDRELLDELERDVTETTESNYITTQTENTESLENYTYGSNVNQKPDETETPIGNDSNLNFGTNTDLCSGNTLDEDSTNNRPEFNIESELEKMHCGDESNNVSNENKSAEEKMDWSDVTESTDDVQTTKIQDEVSSQLSVENILENKDETVSSKNNEEHCTENSITKESIQNDESNSELNEQDNIESPQTSELVNQEQETSLSECKISEEQKEMESTIANNENSNNAESTQSEKEDTSNDKILSRAAEDTEKEQNDNDNNEKHITASVESDTAKSISVVMETEKTDSIVTETDNTQSVETEADKSASGGTEANKSSSGETEADKSVSGEPGTDKSVSSETGAGKTTPVEIETDKSASVEIEIAKTTEIEVEKNTSVETTAAKEVNDKPTSPKENSSSNLDQEKDKAIENQRENTEFVQVNTENEKDSEDNDKDDDANNRTLMEHDPIASDSFEPIINEDIEGADEELCIIPDTEREISQAEKDAASSIPPLRDLTAASSSSFEGSSETLPADGSGGSPIIVFKYEKEDLQICYECKLKRKVKYYYSAYGNVTNYICDDNCLNVFKRSQDNKVALNWEEGSLRVKSFSGATKVPPTLSFIRKCASCNNIANDIENNLTWEIMDFCNELCLSKYQKEIGSHCSSCQAEVKSNSLGKYCVRFGNDIRQFCTSMCLEKYKKGLKVCSYCQQDMSSGPQGFLAPVGDKGMFKDFCSQNCMEKYDVMTNDRPPKVAPGTLCSVCKAEKTITIEFELDGSSNYFCSEPCFVAFSFVNNITPGKCAMCRRHFSKSTLEKHTMYYDNVQHSFCSNSCENIYIIAHRKIVPCSWCKVKKYNFDMIRRYSKTGSTINMCSVNCLSLYNVSINAVNSRKTLCNFCQKLTHPMYHLTMSDATLRNFCSYNCVMSFQNQFPKQPITLNNLGESGFPVPTGAPKKNKKHPGAPEIGTPISEGPQLPIISSVQSLASTNGNISSSPMLPPSLTPINTRSTRSKTSANATQVINSSPQMPIINSYADLPVQVQLKQHFIVRPAPVPKQRNVGTMCYTRKLHKSTTMKPVMVNEEVQTEEREASKILIPVPIPIYVPTPTHMFSVPTPVPVPFPVPVPIPIFIPTSRNSVAGIMKEIKKIQVKIPTDPYEAELLMMAEMVAEEKKETDSESDIEDTAGPEDSYSPEPVDASNTFGDDMLQMALKMATELDEPAVDLEGALTANTITAPQDGEQQVQEQSVDDPQPIHHLMERTPSVRGRKRGMRQSRGGAKRGRRMSHHNVDIPLIHHQVQQPPPPPEPAEKPDANMCLKYTFGVNAWKQWVTTKNAELEKSTLQVMLFKTEILQLTSDELNYSLCLFVKEVRKPNGAEYAPDTIYYLCLGIQQYLFENGRIDNIFCDPYYEKFTDCLDEVAKKFSVLYNDSHYIVTRVEEEHLWESKQLGAHSPHVLLSTLMFFNTKHFNLTSVDEHMQLSFSHIMKHWKRNQPGASKEASSRNVLLRFYPPQSAIQNNTRKKKVYEQQENEENPLRCPVKLYEFYLSKCPESVKTRNDVFYLQPERSCVPDSPVWYSTMPLPREALEKMLHRVKMVKEINVALLTS